MSSPDPHADAGDEVVVGVDLGTSSLKAVALDAAGRPVASAHAAYETARPAAGRAEQDPQDWTEAAADVLSQLAATVPSRSWRAIGLSGMLPTMVTVDAAGLPTGPALTWEDCRADEEAGEILQRCGAQWTYDHTGQPLDARYLLPMFAWTRRHDPARAARTATVMGAKDYLFGWLTGSILTDASTATGYGCYGLAEGSWLPRVAEAAGLTLEPGEPGRPGLPSLAASTDTRPLLSQRAATLGLPAHLPVCVGAADSVLAAEALGALRPGAVAYVWGTSTVILGAASGLTLDPERRCLVTPFAAGGWGLEMDLVSTGAAVAWLARLLGFDEDGQAEVLAAAASAEPGGTPLALPFVGVGEQGALWDAAVRGTVVGLDLSHGPADVSRAFLDGIILESRRCLSRLHDLGLPVGEVRVAWRDADPWFCRRLADASGRPVLVGNPASTSSAAGAARLAAAATGLRPSPVEDEARYTPDRTQTEYWDARAGEYDDVLRPLRRLYASWPPSDGRTRRDAEPASPSPQ